MKYIEELILLSQAQDQARLEYLAYCNLLKGIVKNELKEFSVAYNSLEKSKLIIEELIKTQSNNDTEVLDRKLNEIETIMRVCQYSADMYDVIIEIDENELNNFKINQLTEAFMKSEIKESRNILMKLGAHTFKLSQAILLDDPTYKNVQLSRKLLKENDSIGDLLLQVAYFENRHLSKIIKRQIIRKGVDCDKLLKIVSRLKGYEADKNYSKSIDLLCNFLKSFKDCDLIRIREAFELIKENKECFDKYKFKFLSLLLSNRKKMMKGLSIDKNKSNKPALFVVSAAPVPPKPSFYDMAFDCLTSTATISDVNPIASPKSTGFSNLLSSFWGKK